MITASLITRRASFALGSGKKKVSCFPVLLVSTLPQFILLDIVSDYFNNRRETAILACEMFTSGFRPRRRVHAIKHVRFLSHRQTPKVKSRTPTSGGLPQIFKPICSNNDKILNGINAVVSRQVKTENS